MGKIEIVNPPGRVDPRYAQKRWILQFGAYHATSLMIWADHLQDALDEALDWIGAHEPGLLCDEEVRERFAELLAGREAEVGRALAWDVDNEEMSKILELAEVDTTCGGNHSVHVHSWEWAIYAEDPTREEIKRLQALQCR